MKENLTNGAIRQRKRREALKDQGLIRLTGNICYIHPDNKSRAEKYLFRMRRPPKLSD